MQYEYAKLVTMWLHHTLMVMRAKTLRPLNDETRHVVESFITRQLDSCVMP